MLRATNILVAASSRGSHCRACFLVVFGNGTGAAATFFFQQEPHRRLALTKDERRTPSLGFAAARRARLTLIAWTTRRLHHKEREGGRAGRQPFSACAFAATPAEAVLAAGVCGQAAQIRTLTENKCGLCAWVRISHRNPLYGKKGRCCLLISALARFKTVVCKAINKILTTLALQRNLLLLLTARGQSAPLFCLKCCALWAGLPSFKVTDYLIAPLIVVNVNGSLLYI